MNSNPTASARFFRAKDHRFPLGARTYVVGILNVTPDSFSDGGLYADVPDAVARALAMVRDGADMLDIGGESTRPGHRPVSEEEETARILPVIRRLREETDVPLSIDTSKATVALAALEAGASVINDVRAFRADAGMATVAAETGAGVILMYNATPLPDGKTDPDPTWASAPDLLSGMVRQLSYSLRLAAENGIETDRIMVDPGIGFGVTAEASCAIIRNLSALSVLGVPILLGPSRKSFIGKVLDLPVEKRLMGTAASVALGIAGGADFVRVHDVAEMKEVVRMTDAIIRGCFDER